MRVGPPPPTPHAPRNRRRFWLVVAGVVLSLAALVGVLFIAAGRDEPDLNSANAGPGRVFPDQGTRHLALGEEPKVRFNSDPPTSGPHIPDPVLRDGIRLTQDQVLQALERGNVVVFFDSPRSGHALRALQRQLTGPFDPTVAAAGQALILARRPGTKGVIAAAWRHLLSIRSPSDPQLTAFAQYWIGRGAQP